MNSLKRLAFTLLFSFFLLLHSFAADKGLKALADKNYEKAYQIFTEKLAQNPDDVIASYGMCKLLATPEFAQYNIEKAYVYLINTKEAYKLLDEKGQKKLTKTEVKEENILALQEKIDLVAFQNAVAANNPDSLESFVLIHKTSSQIENALTIKEQLEYLSTQKANTPEAYEAYIKKHPKSKKVIEARQKYDQLLYESLTADGSLNSFRSFMEKYPESPYHQEAAKKLEKLEFMDQVKVNSVEGYEKFVENNPESKYRNMAEDSIYARFTSFPSISEYETFVRKYPKNRNIRDAWEKLYILYNDSGTPETFESFKARYPDYKEAHQLDNDIELSNFGVKMLNTGFRGFKEDQIDAYIRLAAPTEQSITVLKLRIKPFLDQNQYQKAIALLQKYQPYYLYKSYRLASWVETLQRVKEAYQTSKKVPAYTLN